MPLICTIKEVLSPLSLMTGNLNCRPVTNILHGTSHLHSSVIFGGQLLQTHTAFCWGLQLFYIKIKELNVLKGEATLHLSSRIFTKYVFVKERGILTSWKRNTSLNNKVLYQKVQFYIKEPGTYHQKRPELKSHRASWQWENTWVFSISVGSCSETWCL